MYLAWRAGKYEAVWVKENTPPPFQAQGPDLTYHALDIGDMLAGLQFRHNARRATVLLEELVQLCWLELKEIAKLCKRVEEWGFTREQ